MEAMDGLTTSVPCTNWRWRGGDTIFVMPAAMLKADGTGKGADLAGLACLGVPILIDVISDVDVLHASMKSRIAHVMLAYNVVLRDLGRYHGVTILEFLIESGHAVHCCELNSCCGA